MRSSRSDNDRSWRRLVKLPAFFAVNAALLLVVGISAVRETYRGWTVENEIRALEAQAAQLEGRKLKLADVMGSLSSPEHVDFEARARLGWKKEGESVYVIPGFKAATSSFGMPAIAPAEVPSEPVISYPERWLRYFLRDRRPGSTLTKI